MQPGPSKIFQANEKTKLSVQYRLTRNLCNQFSVVTNFFFAGFKFFIQNYNKSTDFQQTRINQSSSATQETTKQQSLIFDRKRHTYQISSERVFIHFVRVFFSELNSFKAKEISFLQQII
eukprot:TRINITY_DN14430_c0_g3_i2.p3 TRINITY_DN14430_c0_g3~~TRINITY_DN14430_c0_g3_i2.p3  ORF type:complete len:120 (+),score=5.06 TRINITY_DN14430_c0_g3_i2:857-1216(+)